MATKKKAARTRSSAAAASSSTSSSSSSSSSGAGKAITDTALRGYMQGEGKGSNDVVTFDDLLHAARFGGAAPASPKRHEDRDRPQDGDEGAE